MVIALEEKGLLPGAVDAFDLKGGWYSGYNGWSEAFTSPGGGPNADGALGRVTTP